MTKMSFVKMKNILLLTIGMTTGLSCLSNFEARAGSILDLQKSSVTQTFQVSSAAGTSQVKVTDLNSKVGGWFLIEITGGVSTSAAINIENPAPSQVHVQATAAGFTLTSSKGSISCDLWSNLSNSELLKANQLKEPYSPICNGNLFVRKKTIGHESTIEAGAEFLREHGGGLAESLLTAVKDVTGDQYRTDAQIIKGSSIGSTAKEAGRPRAAALDAGYQDSVVNSSALDIALQDGNSQAMQVGRWYAAKNHAGVYVSTIAPEMISPDVLNSYPKRVNPLNEKESSAMSFLVAFDLSQNQIGWAHGTNLPGVGWSPRASDTVRIGAPEDGPDGFGTMGPLTTPAVVNPYFYDHLTAVISGGFQRRHSAFKWGTLSQTNHGSHYGFIENGVVMSTLEPGLATIVSDINGDTDLKVWKDSDNSSLGTIVNARQNGVPLIDGIDAQDISIPGIYVNQWGPGNWSGSADKVLMTPRGAACLQEENGHRYFIYAYLSSGTPSSLARVFQAYHCKTAIHLDMNSPGQAYLALVDMISASGSDVSFKTEHLVKGMSSADTTANGKSYPRYVVTPDFRDFFYIYQK
jgi:hypothetical protein